MAAPNDPTPRRTSVLTYLLVGSVAIAFLAFMVVITAGFFVHVISFAVVMALVAAFHYLVWGKFLSEHLAKEMEEARLLERARDEELRPGVNRTARDGVSDPRIQGRQERLRPR